MIERVFFRWGEEVLRDALERQRRVLGHGIVPLSVSSRPVSSRSIPRRRAHWGHMRPNQVRPLTDPRDPSGPSSSPRAHEKTVGG
jgi:hypothetical protein